jgi:hypothetical protein
MMEEREEEAAALRHDVDGESNTYLFLSAFSCATVIFLKLFPHTHTIAHTLVLHCYLTQLGLRTPPYNTNRTTAARTASPA